LWQIRFFLPVAVLALTSCVSGAPTLSDEQEHKLSILTVYPLGQLPTKPYVELATISAADCAGSPMHGRATGNVDRAMDMLKRKAVAINADSIIDVSCGFEPMVNSCWAARWAAQKCGGRAIAFSEPPAAPVNSEQ
jgi:hypothetical protein